MANNNIAYIEKTLPGVIDEVFYQKSLTERLFGKNAVKVDFLDAKVVKVFKLATTGLYDYKRGGSGNNNTRGAVASSTETFTLGQERYSEIPVDALDTLDDGGTIIGHLATQFAQTKCVPEFDAYRFSKLASYTSATYGNRVVETISANTIISKFNKAFKWMKDQKVSADNQVIYVSTSVMEQIRNTTELVKHLTQEEYKGENGVSFTIEKYEGREIIEVPEDEFVTDLITGDGYYPSASSKVINFLVVDTTAPIVVSKLAFTKIYDSNEGGSYLGYVGSLLANLFYHDLFVPDNKKPGIYASVSQVGGVDVSSALLVNAVAGTTQGKSIIVDVLTQPAGILYDALYLATASTKPAIGSSTSALTLLTLGAEFTPDNSHNFIVASLGGKAVAVSKDFTNTLPVGA